MSARLPRWSGRAGSDLGATGRVVRRQRDRRRHRPDRNHECGVWIGAGVVRRGDRLPALTIIVASIGRISLAKMAASGDLKKVRAMILADLVGGTALQLEREQYSTVELVDLIWGTAKRLGYGAIFVDQTMPVDDDHLSFLQRGVPSADVIDLVNSAGYWHTPQDTLDKVSARSLGIVGHVILESVKELQRQ